MTEITEVKDLKVKWYATPIKKLFAKNAELSNAIIVGITITSFYTFINQNCSKNVQPRPEDSQTPNEECY